MNCNIHFSDGTSSVNSDTMNGALRVIARRYNTDVSSLVTEYDGARTLVWLDEETANNDDGSRAVAEILPA